MGVVQDFKREALENAKPCLALIGAAAPSTSYLGGLPELPGECVWPEQNGVPLPFLGQIDLGAAPKDHWPEWMPCDGALLFFFDAESYGFDLNERVWSVLYVPAETPTAVRLPPHTLSDRSLHRRDIAFKVTQSVPSLERIKRKLRARFSEAEFAEVLDFYEDIESTDRKGQPLHQLFGWQAPVQGDEMEWECELASEGRLTNDDGAPSERALIEVAERWRFLFQLSSDDDAGMMWGDGGALFFWVRPEDALRCDFSKVWMVAQ